MGRISDIENLGNSGYLVDTPSYQLPFILTAITNCVLSTCRFFIPPTPGWAIAAGYSELDVSHHQQLSPLGRIHFPMTPHASLQVKPLQFFLLLVKVKA